MKHLSSNLLSRPFFQNLKKQLYYLTPSLFVLVALIIQYFLHPMLGEKSFLLLYPTVFFASLLDGFIPYLIAVLFCDLGALYLFVPHGHGHGAAIKQQADTFSLTVFIVTGFAFCIFSARLRATHSRLKKSEDRQRLLAETSVAIAEENAKLYQQAQHAIRAKEDMVAIVSHDLKSPLTVILLNAELLLKHMPCDIRDGFIGKNILRVQKSARKAAILIHDLLDLGKIESGVFKIEKIRTEVAEVLNKVTDVMIPIAEIKSIHLEIVFPQNLIVNCDQERINQVLSNLIGNAVKFTPAMGMVRVSVSEQEEGIQFSISDSGCGISELELPHIFERYWQANGSATIGTGLGLFIAKSIVESHGGRIWVESELNVGTIFSFIIPHAIMNTSFAPNRAMDHVVNLLH